MNCAEDTRQQSQINLVDIPAFVREMIYELRTWTCCLQNTDHVGPTDQTLCHIKTDDMAQNLQPNGSV